MKLIEEVKSYFTEKVLVAASFTFLSYSFTIISFEKLKELWSYILRGTPLLKFEIVNAKIISDLPILPLIITWFIIGILGYYLYYTLNLFYVNIYNWLVLKTRFTNTEITEDMIKISTLKRLIIHLFVILFFTTLVVLTVYLLFPGADIIRETYFRLIEEGLDKRLIYVASFVDAFLYWLIIINIFFIYGKTCIYFSLCRKT